MLDLQSVSHAFIDVASRVQFARALVERSEHTRAAGSSLPAHRDILRASLLLSRLLHHVSATCVQYHGARGYLSDSPAGQLTLQIPSLQDSLGVPGDLVKRLARSAEGNPDAPQGADREIASDVSEFLRELSTAPDPLRTSQLFLAFGRRSLSGLLIASCAGGRSGSAADLVTTAQAFGRHARLSEAVRLLVTAGTIAPLIELHGSASVKEAYLSSLCAGELIASLAATEVESATSLPWTLTCHAVEEDGDWVLNGHKRFITNAPEANLLVVLAATGSHRGPLGMSLFAVPAQHPGVHISNEAAPIGLQGVRLGAVSLADCRISSDGLLGQENRGFGYLTRVLSAERLAIAAGASGAALRAIDLLRCVPSDRRRGLGISEHALCAMEAASEAVSAFTQATAARASQLTANVDDACRAKAVGTEVCQQVILQCLRLAHAVPPTCSALEQLHRDVLALSIFAGSSGAMKDALAATLLGSMQGHQAPE